MTTAPVNKAPSQDPPYGFAFLQNFVVLGSLRVVPIGLFLLIVLFLIGRQSTYSLYLIYLVIPLLLAMPLGIYDIKKRYKLLVKNLQPYTAIGKRFSQLRITIFVSKTDLKFTRERLSLFIKSGEAMVSYTSLAAITAIALSSWLLISNSPHEFFKHDFQKSLYPLMLVVVELTIFRVARFVYWKFKIVPMIKRDFGYDFQALYRVTERR